MVLSDAEIKGLQKKIMDDLFLNILSVSDDSLSFALNMNKIVPEFEYAVNEFLLTEKPEYKKDHQGYLQKLKRQVSQTKSLSVAYKQPKIREWVLTNDKQKQFKDKLNAIVDKIHGQVNSVETIKDKKNQRAELDQIKNRFEVELTNFCQEFGIPPAFENAFLKKLQEFIVTHIAFVIQNKIADKVGQVKKVVGAKVDAFKNKSQKVREKLKRGVSSLTKKFSPSVSSKEMSVSSSLTDEKSTSSVSSKEMSSPSSRIGSLWKSLKTATNNTKEIMKDKSQKVREKMKGGVSSLTKKFSLSDSSKEKSSPSLSTESSEESKTSSSFFGNIKKFSGLGQNSNTPSYPSEPSSTGDNTPSSLWKSLKIATNNTKETMKDKSKQLQSSFSSSIDRMKKDDTPKWFQWKKKKGNEETSSPVQNK